MHFAFQILLQVHRCIVNKLHFRYNYYYANRCEPVTKRKKSFLFYHYYYSIRVKKYAKNIFLSLFCFLFYDYLKTRKLEMDQTHSTI